MVDRKLLQATLKLCRFVGPDEAGRVLVTLETERKMYIDRLKSPVIEQELKQVIKDVAGREVTVELRVAGDAEVTSAGSPSAGSSSAGAASAAVDAASAGADQAPATRGAKPGPKAKQLLRKFGGRVVQVNPQDRIKERPESGAADHDVGDETLDPGLPPED